MARAARGILSCDLAEPGLAYVAVPIGKLQPDRPREMLLEILQRAGMEVCDADWEFWPSYLLLQNDAISATTLPFLTWKVSAACRALLMTGDVVLVTVARKTVWQEAFRRADVECAEIDGTWKIVGYGHELVYDAFDVERLRNGLAFSGVSPRAVAEYAAINLINPDAFHVQRYRRSADEPLESVFIRDPKTGEQGDPE